MANDRNRRPARTPSPDKTAKDLPPEAAENEGSQEPVEHLSIGKSGPEEEQQEEATDENESDEEEWEEDEDEDAMLADLALGSPEAAYGSIPGEYILDWDEVLERYYKSRESK